MNTNMASNQAFNSIPANRLKRAAHDLSHSRKFTMNMGDLVPIMVQDVIPGDSFQVKMEGLIRMMPMIAPIYHNVNAYMHFFFVPNRIIWDEWEDFITGGKNGTAAPVFPRFYNDTPQNFSPKLGIGTLADYLGFPSKQVPVTSVSLPLANAFSQMPSAIRKRFNNDPAELIKFVLDPKNREEAIKIGLIDTPEPKKEALSDEIIRKLSESMSMEKKLQNEANLKPSETEKK